MWRSLVGMLSYIGAIRVAAVARAVDRAPQWEDREADLGKRQGRAEQFGGSRIPIILRIFRAIIRRAHGCSLVLDRFAPGHKRFFFSSYAPSLDPRGGVPVPLRQQLTPPYRPTPTPRYVADLDHPPEPVPQPASPYAPLSD